MRVNIKELYVCCNVNMHRLLKCLKINGWKWNCNLMCVWYDGYMKGVEWGSEL
jgi:hypothetical protein